MPNLNWSRLTHMQIGKYAEYYCKMEFTSYGLDVYTSEVDDHGVDFVIKDRRGNFYEVQVKSIRKTNYAFIPKDKIKTDKAHLVCLVKFTDGEMPKLYVFPATVWNNPNEVFVDRPYDKEMQKSKAEWGINYSKKHLDILEIYAAEKTLDVLENCSST